MPKILIIGHSHILALKRAWGELGPEQTGIDRIDFLLLRSEEYLARPDSPLRTARSVAGINKDAVRRAIAGAGADSAILCLNGNEHTVMTLSQDHRPMPAAEKSHYLSRTVHGRLSDWLDFLLPILPKHVSFLLPPPPVASDERLRRYQQRNLAQIEPAPVRIGLWHSECQAARAVAQGYAIPVIGLPDSVFSPSGCLADDCCGNDPTHANSEYGRRVLAHALRAHRENFPGLPAEAPAEGVSSPHPYVVLADHCFWKQAVSQVSPEAVDPVTIPPFKISSQDKVATAGSCFAQHISRRLREGGFHFLVTEKPEGGEGEAEARGFYDFSARYGNVYTARQLVQLFDRAFGYFKPVEPVWKRPAGGFCDPFRPRIEPEGFPSEEAVIKDGRRHLAAVRRMFQRLDVFVFTLGLTECWLSRLDGAAYPVAPGVAGGEYEPKKHVFANFGVAEVTADLRLFLQKLKLVNPKARMILTVSPVPLVATAADRHVLVATTYSKSVLRVAAEEIASAHENVYYFPSYEIITGPHAGGSYFGADRRSVTERGVDHVMRVFMARLTESGDSDKMRAAMDEKAIEQEFAEVEALVEAACDEEMLAR